VSEGVIRAHGCGTSEHVRGGCRGRGLLVFTACTLAHSLLPTLQPLVARGPQSTNLDSIPDPPAVDEIFKLLCEYAALNPDSDAEGGPGTALGLGLSYPC